MTHNIYLKYFLKPTGLVIKYELLCTGQRVQWLEHGLYIRGLKYLRFDSQLGAYTWVAGPIPTPSQGACRGQPIDMSLTLMSLWHHSHSSLSLSLPSPPLSLKSMEKIALLLGRGLKYMYIWVNLGNKSEVGKVFCMSVWVPSKTDPGWEYGC